MSESKKKKKKKKKKKSTIYLFIELEQQNTQKKSNIFTNLLDDELLALEQKYRFRQCLRCSELKSTAASSAPCHAAAFAGLFHTPRGTNLQTQSRVAPAAQQQQHYSLLL